MFAHLADARESSFVQDHLREGTLRCLELANFRHAR